MSATKKAAVLTEAVRRKPYSVVLFDEIEKAHRDVFNVLLQVLDDGRLTDGQGRTVNFKNTVIVMTSNIGSAEIQKLASKDAESWEVEAAVKALLKDHFRPEFLNRIDETILFHSLTRDQIGKIVDVQIDHLRKRLADRHLKLTLSPRRGKTPRRGRLRPRLRRPPPEAGDSAAHRKPGRQQNPRRRIRGRRYDHHRRRFGQAHLQIHAITGSRRRGIGQLTLPPFIPSYSLLSPRPVLWERVRVRANAAFSNSSAVLVIHSARVIFPSISGTTESIPAAR